MNITLTSLTMHSMITSSPLYSITRFNHNSRLLLNHLYFSNFISNFIYSNHQNHQLLIQNSKFHFSLNSVVHLTATEPDCRSVLWKKDLHFTGKPIKNINITYDDYKYLGDSISDYRSYILCNNSETLGDVIIAGCAFIGCKAGYANGGAISIEQNSNVMIHDSLFIACSTVRNGGALFICRTPLNTETDKGGDLENFRIPKLDVQYCCFQDCYTYQSGDNPYERYGVAMFSAADETTLFYASTTNCSFNDGTRGAQFDLQAEDISSKYINITGGKALSTCGIEYRKATTGYFIYQTMAKMYCTWVTAFTNAEIDNLNLSFCNYIDNIIKNCDNGNNIQPGLVFIKNTDIIIDHFYFKGTDFDTNSNAKIVARDSGGSSNKNIKMINCYIDNYNANLFNLYTTENLFTGDFDIFPIILLNKGGCQGEKTPEPLIITSIFTPSQYFSKTECFSETEHFTKSAGFTHSFEFSSSTFFSQSDKFSKSDQFSKSSLFTETNKFSKSSVFTETDKFSKSSLFTKTDQFSKSSLFTETSQFTKSSLFSETKSFSFSKEFTQSKQFTDSDNFLRTQKFTKSSTFTSSNSFSESVKFTESGHFTKTSCFSDTNKFTSTNKFSETFSFSASETYTKSSEFTKSSVFSKSSCFTNSELLIPKKTNDFSNSLKFTESCIFTQSKHDVMIIIKDDSRQEMKFSASAIAGITVAAAALVAIILASIIYLNKKNKQEIDGPEVVETESIDSEPKFVYDNPLFNSNMKDDPFLEDFDEMV